MKRCCKCGLEKMSSGFARDARKPDGLRNDCRECTSKVSPKGPIELVDPEVVWLTKPIGQTYWQQAGEYMLGDRDALPTDTH